MRRGMQAWRCSRNTQLKAGNVSVVLTHIILKFLAIRCGCNIAPNIDVQTLQMSKEDQR